jgi:hypothetical protein
LANANLRRLRPPHERKPNEADVTTESKWTRGQVETDHKERNGERGACGLNTVRYLRTVRE